MTRSRLRDLNRTSLVLAEENDCTRRDLVNALRGAGFHVKDVCRGHDALRAVHAHAPDLVVTDLNLSDMDGVELARELRSNPATRHIPVIGVSCRPTGDRERIGRAGFAQVVVNSCPPRQVVADVRAVLAHQRQRAGWRCDGR